MDPSPLRSLTHHVYHTHAHTVSARYGHTVSQQRTLMWACTGDQIRKYYRSEKIKIITKGTNKDHNYRSEKQRDIKHTHTPFTSKFLYVPVSFQNIFLVRE